MKTLSGTSIVSLMILIGCGGGSSGTGAPDSFIGKVLNGSVVDENAAPVAEAQLTVLESGESTKTDNTGNFSLVTQTQGDISLAVEVGELTSTINVIADDSARTDLKITVNRRTGLVEGTSLSVTAKIVGKCDAAFENNAVIRQANKLASGTQCPVRVTVRSSSMGISGIPYRMEHKKCEAKITWVKDFDELTMQNGVGQSIFVFQNDENHCDYRIVVASDVKGVKEIIFPVVTFTRQEEEN